MSLGAPTVWMLFLINLSKITLKDTCASGNGLSRSHAVVTGTGAQRIIILYTLNVTNVKWSVILTKLVGICCLAWRDSILIGI